MAGVRSAEHRRAQILDIAADIICEEGFANTRVAMIAERAGVANGTIVYHFKTLDRLLVEALAQAETSLADRAALVIAGVSGVRERLDLLVRWVFRDDDEHVRLWKLWMETWSNAARHPEIAAARAAQDARWRGILRDTVRDVPEERSRLFVAGFAAMIDGLAIQLALRDAETTPELAYRIAMDYAAAALNI